MSSSSTSVTASIPARGVRSSCETSEANRRARASACCSASTERSSRAADSLNVLARSASSSLPRTWMRVSRRPLPMERAALFSARTGRSTLRAAIRAGTRAMARPGRAPFRAARSRASASSCSSVILITANRRSPVGRLLSLTPVLVTTAMPMVRKGTPLLTTRWKPPCGVDRVTRRSSGVTTEEVGLVPEETRSEPYSANTIQGCGLALPAMTKSDSRSISGSTGSAGASVSACSRKDVIAVSCAPARTALRASR